MAVFTSLRQSRTSVTDAGLMMNDRAVSSPEFLKDVVTGLAHPEKSLPCKYFYDEAGSLLFDQICDTDEYYPTRTEFSIMRAHLPEMARRIGMDAQLIEFGSGTSLKTRLLLAELHQPAGYVPIDICREHLATAALDLAELFPRLAITPICGDYMTRLSLPEAALSASRRVVYFPGSTIGNFYPSQAVDFLENAVDLCSPGGGMLIGVDLKKDETVLNAAYNDRANVTAQFNLNLLHRINHELGGNFAINQFEHRAFYNAFRSRIEMHLVSRCPQRVTIGDACFTFQTGESILTECSYKYTLESFTELAELANWQVKDVWIDQRGYFAVLYLAATRRA